MKTWWVLVLCALGCSGGEDLVCTSDAALPACGTDTWANFGQDFFATHCSGCHAGFDQSAVQASASTYSAALSSGAMPRGGGLSGCDRARAVAYLNCGAP